MKGSEEHKLYRDIALSPLSNSNICRYKTRNQKMRVINPFWNLSKSNINFYVLFGRSWTNNQCMRRGMNFIVLIFVARLCAGLDKTYMKPMSYKATVTYNNFINGVCNYFRLLIISVFSFWNSSPFGIWIGLLTSICLI